MELRSEAAGGETQREEIEIADGPDEKEYVIQRPETAKESRLFRRKKLEIKKKLENKTL